MKKKVVIIILIVIALIITTLYIINVLNTNFTNLSDKIEQIYNDKSDDIVVAYVNDDPIYLNDVRLRYYIEVAINTEKVKDAESLVAKNMTENDYIMALNNIAGAPDWQGGSGIGRAIYYLDEEHNESIIVMSNSIMYVVYDEKGNSIEKPIGDQVVPSPKPTQAKKN